MLHAGTLLLALAPLALSPGQEASEPPRLVLRAHDRICLVGNALAERMQHHGWLEARLQARRPELELSFRNLGFAADELTVQQRTAGFGDWTDHLAQCEADVVFAFFGFVESFRGESGVETFRSDLEEFVRRVRAEEWNGESTARLALFSSIPFEDLGDPSLPSGVEHNARIERYNDVMREVARTEGVPFVDLFEPMQARYRRASAPLTLDGIHLGEHGNEVLSEVIAEALTPRASRASVRARLEELRQAVLAKNLLWFNRYRATDGYNVYGGRSSLTYDGVTNAEVLQRELAILDAETENADRRIWSAAAGDAPVTTGPEVPPAIPVETNRPGPGPEGAHVYESGEQAIEHMTVADGFEVRLFADEARFPELANPVQMAWDTRGRLWVAAWPTYPHWAPGEPMNDRLLILEDVDHDGRADTCKTFADDLHNPTGFELWNGGVYVANAPDVLFLEDTDGDDRADRRTRVLSALSSADTHHSANSFVIGPSGGLYFQEGVFHRSQIESIWGPVRNHDACVWRFVPKTGRVERYFAHYLANPHGHVFDRWGQDFVTDGTGNDNFYALPVSGHVAHPAKHKGYFTFFQQRSRPAAATEILSSSLFPVANQGNYLIANVIGFQGIFQYELADDGSGFRADEVEPLVKSSDPNFRPVDIEVGPDGGVYFLDWHNALIGHMQHHLRDPSRDHVHGRVYRIAPRNAPAVVPPKLHGRPIDELVGRLAHAEDRVRYRARIELSARDSSAVVSAARDWVAALDDSDPDHEHRLVEALWLQSQHDVLDEALLDRLLDAEDFRARAAAVRVLRHLRHRAHDPLRLLREAVADEHPRVRLEAVVAASFFPSAESAALALEALRPRPEPMDRFLAYALDETLRTLEPVWRAAIIAGDPVAERNPKGLAFLLERLDDNELLLATPSEARSLEMLTRHGLRVADHRAALAHLAEVRSTSSQRELIDAIARADARDGGHTDHLVSRLFAAVQAIDIEDPAELDRTLGELGANALRSSTRRMATAARMRRDGSIEPAWTAAASSPRALAELLDSASLLDDEELARALFPRAAALVAGDDSGAENTQDVPARFVRIELPGDERTLTLAEVEVFDRAGANVARAGTATQSSVAWGGSAERAIDGNTSGVFADGGQSHTSENRSDTWWEVDLGSPHVIDRIVVWNRTEGDADLRNRLADFIVRVLDPERRTLFEARVARAPDPNTSIELPNARRLVRRAAALALASLGVREDEAASLIAGNLDDEDVGTACVEALLAIEPERWMPGTRDRVAARLLERFANAAPSEFVSEAALRTLALADALIPSIDRDTALELFAARRELGPQVIVLRSVPDQLLFDRRELVVVAGRRIRLTFDNVDIMPHNVVVTVPGALARVGMAAEAMAAQNDAWERGFVPELDEVLFATDLVQPGRAQTIEFEAPDEPGDYPFVCTFPGHWIRMNGVMRVVDEADATALSPPTAPAPGPAREPARRFVRNWSLDDLRPHFGSNEKRSVARGRMIFESASCVRCHSVGGEGGTTGPPLEEVVARYETEELVTQILQPSLDIAEGYAAEIFVTTDGAVIAGPVTDEDEEAVYVRDDPYRDDSLVLVHEEIAERSAATLSTMPSELLSTFELAEVLDLIAYLASLAAPEND